MLSDAAPRHCERSEAIHLAAEEKRGLLRRFAPRNDDDTAPIFIGCIVSRAPVGQISKFVSTPG